jgi:hypothetical protein
LLNFNTQGVALGYYPAALSAPRDFHLDDHGMNNYWNDFGSALPRYL